METLVDRDKSLQELEGVDWGEPTYLSALTTKVYGLRRKPLKDFAVEELRIMIGQSLSLQYLIPIALEHLDRNWLAEGKNYRGDLLTNVVGSDPEFWVGHPDLFLALEVIVQRALAGYEAEDEEFPGEIEDLRAIVSDRFATLQSRLC